MMFLVIAGLALREWAAAGGGGPGIRQAIGQSTRHPDVLDDRLFLDSSVAARTGGLQADAVARLRELASVQPLASEPFLLAGASAQLAGDWRGAERRYLAARLREPRSSAARFLLADLYFRSGRPEEGIAEMIVLSRLEPRAVGSLGPALANYAKQPGATATLAKLAGRDLPIRDAMLIELAKDPANAALVLRLAPKHPPGEPSTPWERLLLEGLAGAGKFAQAEDLWAKVTGRVPTPPVNNPRFAKVQPVPPFDWTLYAGPAGVVEPDSGGGLSVFHYGREPMVAARQLLRLQPGPYSFRTKAVPPAADRMSWRLTCVSGSPLATIPFRIGSHRFDVPAGCRGQWLELHVSAGEPAPPLQVRIAEVAVRRGR